MQKHWRRNRFYVCVLQFDNYGNEHMNDLTVQEYTEKTNMVPVLKSSLYPGASDDSIRMVLSYCQMAKLDPMQKPVHIVPMWNSNAGRMQDVIMPGIGLYRTQAARSGEYGGISEPVFGEHITETIDSVTVTYPQSCKITVYRLVNGQQVGFSAIEFWKENYAVKGGKTKSIAPNAMWSRRPFAQLAKCAEAQALRKAFPEFGAMPTAEEMEGKETFERDITPETVDLTQELLAIESAESIEQLQDAYKTAYIAHTGKKEREILIEAKNKMKGQFHATTN